MNRVQKELDFVNKRFDRDASAFNAIYSDDGSNFLKWFNKKFRKPVFERFDIAFAEMGDVQGKSIIDVGCGSGIYLTNLVLKGAESVLGVDFSSEMLNLARAKLNKIPQSKRCELRKANFLELALNEKFHFSLAMGVFDYQPDPVSFLERMKEVTSEKVIASFPANSLIRGPLRKLRYTLTARGNVYYYTQADIEKIANKVGFRNYRLVPIKTGKGFIFVGSP